ncbi:MAG: RNA-binding S4 domain-containing protein [Thalassotalea sp.]|nr:RNA-binding S4 domain-containing protein [Thalassotalea sp.]MDG2394689.1 RNA-binding S4 domain-containing protein [Thalassotalea sp.]
MEEIEVLVIDVDAEPIELCKLLKIANLVGGGGEAKMVISEGYVYLNGEVEYQKRKKVYFEDVVQFNGEAIMPLLRETTEDELMPLEQVEKFNEVEQANSFTENKEQFKPTNKAKQSDNKNKAKKSKGGSKTGSKTNKEKPAAKEGKPSSKKNSRTGRKSISF